MSKQTLRLYIVGYTPIANRAIRNLALLDREPGFNSRYDTEVINILERPDLAEEERILATPVLVRRHPGPVRRFVGDLSNREQVLLGLDIYAEADEETGE